VEAFSNFLQEDYRHRLDAEGLEYLEHLRAASRRLSTQIDSLLTLSRAGRVISTPRPFDPADAIATACGDLAGLIQRKGSGGPRRGTVPDRSRRRPAHHRAAGQPDRQRV
jgi:signal transduction histidine kinase